LQSLTQSEKNNPWHYEHLGYWDTMDSYFEIGLKPAVFDCLTNYVAPLPIALESCSNPQKTRQVFKCAMKKIIL